MKRNECKRGVRKLSLVLLACLSPLVMGASGSCQAFQDSFLTSLESATAAALSAAVTSLFDQARSD